jgi:hypothetical protein
MGTANAAGAAAVAAGTSGGVTAASLPTSAAAAAPLPPSDDCAGKHTHRKHKQLVTIANRKWETPTAPHCITGPGPGREDTSAPCHDEGGGGDFSKAGGHPLPPPFMDLERRAREIFAQLDVDKGGCRSVVFLSAMWAPGAPGRVVSCARAEGG